MVDTRQDITCHYVKIPKYSYMLWLSYYNQGALRFTYIAENTTGIQKIWYDDITGFISLQLLPNSCE